MLMRWYVSARANSFYSHKILNDVVECVCVCVFSWAYAFVLNEPLMNPSLLALIGVSEAKHFDKFRWYIDTHNRRDWVRRWVRKGGGCEGGWMRNGTIEGKLLCLLNSFTKIQFQLRHSSEYVCVCVHVSLIICHSSRYIILLFKDCDYNDDDGRRY